MKNSEINKYLLDLIEGWGIPEMWAHPFLLLISIFTLVLICYIINFVTKKLLLRFVSSVVKRTKVEWDDILLEHKVFDRLAHIMPALFVEFSAPIVFELYPFLIDIVYRLTEAYIIFIFLMVIVSIVNVMDFYVKRLASMKDKPTDSYFQLVKIIIYFFAGILIVAKLFGKDPISVLTTFGALTAVLLLIFKDTILGFVASIQIAANDLVRVGDWVSFVKYGADGTVTKITLNTVKVQNWDKTITTIPTYTLVSDSFKNWRGMSESEARRIKRSLSFKIDSVSYCDDEFLDDLSKIHLLTPFLKNRREEIAIYNKENGINKEVLVNGRHLTNLGIFRAYSEAYISNHPNIRPDLTKMIMQLAATELGIPLQVYCFTNTTDWAEFEKIQADIFDHLIAAAPKFKLEIFQAPSGKDFRNSPLF